MLSKSEGWLSTIILLALFMALTSVPANHCRSIFKKLLRSCLW